MDTRIFLIVTWKDVGFLEVDPGELQDGERPSRNLYKFPSLRKGDLIEFISRSETGWLYVKRCSDNFDDCSNAEYGYVDWRYVIVHCRLINLDVVDVVAYPPDELSSREIRYIVDTIDNHIYYTEVPLSFYEMIWQFPTPVLLPPKTTKTKLRVEIVNIMTILTRIANNNPPEDFAEIMLQLHDRGLFYRIVYAIDYKLAKRHPEAYFRLCCLLYFKDLYDILKGQIIEVLWEERKTFLRWPSLANYNPIDKDAIKTALDEITTINPAKVTHRTFVYLHVKLHQITYLLRQGGVNNLTTMIADLDEVLDAGMQLLFSEQSNNRFLEIAWGYTLRDIWNLVRKPIVAPVKIINENGKPLKPPSQAPFISDSYIFNDDTNKLEFDPDTVPAVVESNKPPIAKKELPPVEDPCPNDTKDEGPPNRKEQVKQAVISAASLVHDFIFSKAPEKLHDFPHLTSDINKLIESYKPSYYAKLSFAIYFGFNSQTTAKQLRSGKSHIANKMSWLDLVYIWFYNLGHQRKLGTKGNELTLGQNAKTTKEIMKHPTLKKLYQYTKDRISIGNTNKFKVFVSYDKELFFQSIKANDVVQNFLGSFTVEVTPLVSKNKVRYVVTNELGLESFTRFRQGDADSGKLSNREPILQNVERSVSSSKAVKIGGTLRCRWEWEI